MKCKVCGADFVSQQIGRPPTMCHKCRKLSAARRSKINPDWNKNDPKPAKKPRQYKQKPMTVKLEKCAKPASTARKVHYCIGGCSNGCAFDSGTCCEKQRQQPQRFCEWFKKTMV